MKISRPMLLLSSVIISTGLGIGAWGKEDPASADRTVVKMTAGPTIPEKPTLWYAQTPAGMQPMRLLKLPLGSVKAKGWLGGQLVRQSKGFHGQLQHISTFLKKEGNSWLAKDGQGQFGWEEVPYWLKGFGDCAHLVGDAAQIAEAKLWIEGALASKTEDGFFGPRGQGAKATVDSTKGEWDLWPNMPMLDALRSHYEATGDARVLTHMAAYFRWQLKLEEEKFLPPYWQQMRAYDNLWSVLWLAMRTHDDAALQEDLKKLAAKIHRRAARWDGGIVNWHNVNLAQGFGGAAFYFPFSAEKSLIESAEKNFQTFRKDYGQMPGGLLAADEIARPGYTDPHQAVETCGMVEFMHSCERLLQVTGDMTWADRCEDVAFNQLPAATTHDLRSLRYLSACNMASGTAQSHSPGIMNGGPMFLMDPRDHRCCQHNFGHGWPYLAEHVWMATPSGGAALIFPLASEAEVRVGPEGQKVTLIAEGHYPFANRLTVRVRTEKPVRFPLALRIPGTIFSGTLGPAGEDEAYPVAPGQFAEITRTWSDGDAWVLDMNNEPVVRKWKAKDDHESLSVNYGPLTFSLNIKIKSTKLRENDEWSSIELKPDGAWNYGLVSANPDRFSVEFRPMPEADKSPWNPDRAPILLNTKGKKIPNWTIDAHGLMGALQKSPAKTKEKEEDLGLIPMGAARLRLTAFPLASDAKEAHDWKPAGKVEEKKDEKKEKKD